MGTSCFVVKSISVTSIKVSYIYIDNYLLGSLLWCVSNPRSKREEKREREINKELIAFTSSKKYVIIYNNIINLVFII